MTPTKFLIGQIAVVFAVAIGGMWIATQWAAWKLGYQSQLGPAWFDFLHYPIYRPWNLFAWWYPEMISNEEREALNHHALVALKPAQLLADTVEPDLESVIELLGAAAREIGPYSIVHDGGLGRSSHRSERLKLLADVFVQIKIVPRLHRVPQNAGMRSSSAPRRCSPSLIACAHPMIPSLPRVAVALCESDSSSWSASRCMSGSG